AESQSSAARRRIYRSWTLLAAVFVPMLLYKINLSAETLESIRRAYGTRTQAIVTLMNVLLLGLWLGLFSVYFAGPLKKDARGDAPLVRELCQLRDQRRLQSPRTMFYIATVVGLLLMGILLWIRRNGSG